MVDTASTHGWEIADVQAAKERKVDMSANRRVETGGFLAPEYGMAMGLFAWASIPRRRRGCEGRGVKSACFFTSIAG